MMTQRRSSGILTLTTDFGAGGPYVSAMKGIILGLAPETQLIDVSHTVSPQNILEGAFLLGSIVDAFPDGTVHLAVVDPGVGTARRLIAVRAASQWFVLPDNGLITGVLLHHAVEEVRVLTGQVVRRAVVAPTFHGRDLLAPAAAHLLRSEDPAVLGPPADHVVRLANFEPREDHGGLVGEVIYRDAFGNLITNVTAARLQERASLDSWTVSIAGERIDGLVRTYGDQPAGSVLALTGSTGWVEVAVCNGDAARHLSAGPGTTVWFRRRDA
jgi:S-adenosylmethionine hydrolase